MVSLYNCVESLDISHKKLLDKFSKHFNLENQILGANLVNALPPISEAEMDLFELEGS